MTSTLLRPIPAAATSLALALSLSGCVSTEAQPDGSTRVRISAAHGLGMKAAAPAPSATPATPAQAAPAVTAPRSLPPPPAAMAVPGKKPVKLSAAMLKALQGGIECNPKKTFGAALKASGVPIDGTEVDAPAGMKAFGLPVARISFFPDADYNENFSTAVFAAGVTFDQVRKAGRLTIEKDTAPENTNTYSKYSDFGGLYATRDGAPQVKMACSPPVH